MDDHSCNSGKSNNSYSFQMKDMVDLTRNQLNMRTDEHQLNSKSGAASKYSIRLVQVPVDRAANRRSDGMSEEIKTSEFQFTNIRQGTPGNCIRLLSYQTRPDLPDKETESSEFMRTSEGFTGHWDIGLTYEMIERMKSCTQLDDQPQVTPRYSVPRLSNQTRHNFPGLKTENNTTMEESREFEYSPNVGESDCRSTSPLATTKPASSLFMVSDQPDDIVCGYSVSIGRIKPEEDDSSMNRTGYTGNSSLDVCVGLQYISESFAPPPIEITPIKQEFEYGGEPMNPRPIDLTDHEFGITKGAVKPPKPSVKRWKCPDCNAEFSQVGVMRDHQLSEHKKKPFACHVCSQQFRRRPCFNTHMRIHGPDAKFHVCKFCFKKFTHKNMLERHESAHKPSSISCHDCQKHFRHYETYRGHKDKYHSKEHPYNFQICTVCNQKFVSKYGLRVHMRSHSVGRKPYHCFECRQQFAMDSALRCHVLKCHLALKPFTCGICDSRYSDKAWTTKHVQTHNTEGARSWQKELE